MVMTWLWCSSRSRMAVATTGIAEHSAPLADRAIAGEQQAAALVAARDELEEEMRGVGLEWQIAEFIDDQQLGLGEEAEALLEPVLRMGLGERRHQRWGGHEQHRVAFADGGTSQSNGEMRLADAGRTEQQQGFAMRHPAASGELADLAGIDRRLRREVEAVEITHIREVSDLHRHIDATLVLAGDLALDEEGQRLAQAQLTLCRLVQQVVELVADRRELEAREPAQEGLVVDGHGQHPPATRSYSASGRSKVGIGASSPVVSGRTAPAMPWKCAESMMRCRRPVVSAWAATSWPA